MGLLRPRYLALALGAIVILLAVVVFFYGGPQAPPASSGGSTTALESPDPAEADDPTGASDEATTDGGPLPFEQASGPAPEGGVAMPLIPIPGCKCHSDDPQVVEEHSRYRLSECAECH
jgi:hypothetical protein